MEYGCDCVFDCLSASFGFFDCFFAVNEENVDIGVISGDQQHFRVGLFGIDFDNV